MEHIGKEQDDANVTRCRKSQRVKANYFISLIGYLLILCIDLFAALLFHVTDKKMTLSRPTHVILSCSEKSGNGVL